VPHTKARKEKNCLNCNAEVNGRYCSVCGQENIEPQETFWQLVSHFVYDLFHYDGKVLSTLKTLIFKPGLLTREYVRGRRASYLHPIRLYIFISAVFFIIFISFVVGGKNNAENSKQLTLEQTGILNRSIGRLYDSLKSTNDSAKKAQLHESIDALKNISLLFKQDSIAHNIGNYDESFIKIDTSNHADNFLAKSLPGTLDEYNKQQAALSPAKKDGWLLHLIDVKLIGVNERYRYDINGFIIDLTVHFFHLLPTMMFVSLPITALIFQLLYIRRRKQFTYVQHGVFTVHVYTAIYIFILVAYGFKYLATNTDWLFFKVLFAISIAGIYYYIYKAMRIFYEQGRWKTILKFFILSVTYFIILTTLMIVFFMTSLIQI
jgi:hypothetical protein